ncbi:MAG: Ig-like domain-containing protein, partial [Candidatus Aenigmatarchaeota archaeon]
AIPYVVEGPFFSVNIEDYNEEPSPGEDVVVNYTVTNLGNETDTQDINFTVNGMVKESVEITLAEEEQHNDQFVWNTTNKVGSYYLGVESNETEDIVMVMLGDTKKVSHYNIYQAEDQNGPWDEPIAQVDADGSSSYEFVDTGAAGEPYDWYVVRAVSEDDAEEPNNYAVREPAGPEVTTVSPEDDVIITEDDVTVEWEGSEDIGNYEIQLNDGDLIDVGTDTEYTFENIPEGTHQVFVFGHNETSGEVGYDSVRFKVDRSPPALEIKYPEDGEYINEVSIMAEWQGYDDVSGIQHYSVRVNDGNWTNVEWDTTWELDDLEHGETYTVEVQVTDWAGWDTIESTTFTVDIVDPSIDIEFPVDGEWGSINTTAQWEGFDEVSGVDYYEVRLDGEEWVEVGTETEYEFIDLEVEEHTIEVRANDRAGNDNVTSTTFDIDPENPQLKVVSPGSDTVFDTDKVSVAWSGHDQHSGLSHIEVRLNDGEWIDVGISSSYTFTGLEDGTHTATVKAIDNVYHESYDEVSFTVDTVPPQLSISSPEQGAIYDDGEVTVEWQGSSETTDMDHYEVRLDNGAWEDVGLDESYTFGDLDDGNHLVYVRAIDGAGHTTTETVSFTVDSVAPELEVLAPEDGELFAENEVTVTWDSSDDGSGISHHEVRLDEGEWRDVGTSSLYTFKTLEEGEHVVEVRVTDEAGHTNEGEVSFTVDTSSPELEITSPEPKALFAESEVDVTWDGGDDISGIENYKVRLDQGEWIDAGTDTQYSFDELSDGDHVVELIAEDGAGHTSTETITFSVDTTSPRLYILSPEHEKTIDKDEVTVRFSGNDETSEVAYYEVRVNGGEWIDIGSNTQHTFEGLSEGDNTIEIKAVDDAGNERTTELTVTVDESISIYWWIIIAIVILAVLLVVVMVMVARGGEEEEEEPKAPGMAAAPPAQGTETQETGWDEELYEEPSEEGFEEQEEVPPSQSEEPPTDEEIFEEEEQDDQEVPPPPPPESEGYTEEDLLEDLEEEEETE